VAVVTTRLTSFGIDLANPHDASWTRHRYLFSLGAYGCTQVLVWANNHESALEEVADWCELHAPGLFCDEAVREECDRAVTEGGMGEDEAQEHAEQDTIRSEDHYFEAWEVCVVEDPTREDILNAQRDERRSA
jgi:hypothetical protein